MIKRPARTIKLTKRDKLAEIQYKEFKKFRLSNDGTAIFKYFIPAPFFIIWVIACLFFNEINSELFIRVFLSGFFFITLFMLTMGRTKKIEFDHQYLYVRNWIKKDQIQLNEIKKVIEFYTTPRMAMIVLKHKSKFGKRVLYFQNPSWFLFGDLHSDTKFLYQTIEAKKKYDKEQNKKAEWTYKLFADD